MFVITTFKRKLPNGELERNPVTGLVEVYTLGGPPNDTIPDYAFDIRTGTPDEVRETISDEDRERYRKAMGDEPQWPVLP